MSNKRGYGDHVKTWEAAHGPVPAGYAVHHRDEDVRNNRLTNLRMMTRSGHASYHKRGVPQSKRHVGRRVKSMAAFYAAGGSPGKLSPEERSARARHAAMVRWGGSS